MSLPDWNCVLCSPRTEIGPCSIAAAVCADDLFTSLIGIGVNGVNELPTLHQKQNKKIKKLKIIQATYLKTQDCRK